VAKALLFKVILIKALPAISVCLLGIETAATFGLVFSNPEAPENASGRALTFAERVAYQREIEEVYWRHRIWPKDNRGLKPPLHAVISQRRIEQKVKDYLRNSRLVADQRGRPITASELQAEMDRMASHTKQADVLRELFAALGNDPFLIAECLARPVVAERLVSELMTNAKDASFRAESRNPAARLLANSKRIFEFAQDDIGTNLNNAAYKLPEITAPAGLRGRHLDSYHYCKRA